MSCGPRSLPPPSTALVWRRCRHLLIAATLPPPPPHLRSYRDFWLAQSSFLEALYLSRLATAAAIRGACPAGGTCIALCCDARFITPNVTMGLNEVGAAGRQRLARKWVAMHASRLATCPALIQAPIHAAVALAQVALGIPVPKFWAALMGRTIGVAAAERLVLSGTMVKAPEAVRLGLGDAVAASNEQSEVSALATRWVEAAVKLPPAARAATKQSGRAEFCAAWRRYYTEEEPQYGWRAISDPAAVKMMGAVMARLSGGGKAPGSKL